MNVVNTCAKYHSEKTPDKCMQKSDRVKNKIYLGACLQQHRNFYRFNASVNGLLGVDTTATLKRISSRLATKWRQPYSRTCRYFKIRIAITLVRATQQCIRGSRVPAHRISVQRLQ